MFLGLSVKRIVSKLLLLSHVSYMFNAFPHLSLPTFTLFLVSFLPLSPLNLSYTLQMCRRFVVYCVTTKNTDLLSSILAKTS